MSLGQVLGLNMENESGPLCRHLRVVDLSNGAWEAKTTLAELVESQVVAQSIHRVNPYKMALRLQA